MQISAANLLASQSQTSIRPRGPAAAFEPLAFKQTPPSAATKQPAPAASAPQPSAASSASASTAYVRPGTNLDIKI